MAVNSANTGSVCSAAADDASGRAPAAGVAAAAGGALGLTAGVAVSRLAASAAASALFWLFSIFNSLLRSAFAADLGFNCNNEAGEQEPNQQAKDQRPIEEGRWCHDIEAA